MSEDKDTTTEETSGDKGEAWRINKPPRDKPEWLGKDLHSRSHGEDTGEAWKINENTKGDDDDTSKD